MAGLPEHDEGIRLFNEAEFWHAHEQWERCWLAAQEPDRTFYQGLIQTAAALVHAQRGNQRGLERNWAKARPKVVALLPRHGGVELAALLAAMDRYVRQGGRLPRVAPSAQAADNNSFTEQSFSQNERNFRPS
jgi:uncharacterized protein